MVTHRQQRIAQDSQTQFDRFRIVRVVCLMLCIGIILRLGYWQIVQGSHLRAEAQEQYTSFATIQGSRGKVFTSDGYLLVGNKSNYTLFAQPKQITLPAKDIAQKLSEILALNEETKSQEYQSFLEKLSDPQKKWVSLQNRVTEEERQKIAGLQMRGIGFDKNETRYYPEASLAAHTVGFVGKDDEGKDTGYFGIEGKFNLELASKDITLKTEKDAKGIPLFHQLFDQVEHKDGRDVTLTIRRDIQYMLEKKLAEGVQKYGAKTGEAVVMEARTGRILGMAVVPSYDPEKFYEFPAEMYKNPLVADGYEPGSTFKVLTVASGIDAGLINPDTQCTNCATARQISGYTIKTWNDQYTANISVKDAVAKSDNTAMIFIAEKLGTDRFRDYLSKFKIGEQSGIELQEDAGTLIKDKWRPIDLATASFGQGIATTGMQMVRAVGAIANGGKMLKPTIIESVTVDGQKVTVQPEVVSEPISAETARIMTDIMVYAAQKGEAQWTTSKRYSVAGKTGTAQIPVAGHYDEEKTIASYIGFAPAYDPQFVMLIKLREPGSSQWASETAAPLWYDIAAELFSRLNIPPDRPTK